MPSMIKFLNWLAGLRPTPCMKMMPIEADPPGPPAPAPGSKPEPPAGLPDSAVEGFWSSHQACRVFVNGIEQSPAGPPTRSVSTPFQAQIMGIYHGMKLRAEAEGAAAAQLREIAESLPGVVATGPSEEVLQSIGIVPPLARPVAAPFKPQPSGGRLFINGIEQPKPPCTASLLEMVRIAIDEEPWEDEAKGAVLAVARWLHNVGIHFSAEELEREAGK